MKDFSYVGMEDVRSDGDGEEASHVASTIHPDNVQATMIALNKGSSDCPLIEDLLSQDVPEVADPYQSSRKNQRPQ